MNDVDSRNTAFLNRRDWGTHLALQSAATYPNVVEAVRTGQAWFSVGAAQASHWLIARQAGAEVQRRLPTTVG
jgi:hypothetical protein